MKQFQTVYRGEEAFRTTVMQWRSQLGPVPALLHLFSDGADEADVQAACAVIDEIMPDATYVGSSASGCILDGEVTTEKLVVSCMIFERADSFAETRLFSMEDGDAESFRNAYRECLQSLRNVKAIEVITTIDTIPIRDVCQIVPEENFGTAATLMYQKGGVDIRTLQAILGHSNLGTTQIYTHIADEQIEKAVNANPLAKL